MKFRIDLLGIADLESTTALFSPDILVERWNKRINAPGKMVFSIKSTHPKATDTNLRVFRRVRLSVRNPDSPGYSSEWLGYIEEKTEVNGRIEVLCNGMLGFFSKRLVDDGTSFTGEGSAEALQLVTDANDDSETGISTGEGGVTSTKTLTLQASTDVLKCWELLAQAHGAEYQINDDGTFDFVPSLGSDKSGSIHFVYRRDGQPGTNVNSFQRGESGVDMANRVYAESTNGGSYLFDDPTSQAIYGLIAESKQFNEAQDLSTLTSMGFAYGTQRSAPPPDFRVTPQLARKRLDVLTGTRTLTGLQYSDISIGDLVTVTAFTANQSETVAKRIAEIEVLVDDNGNEAINLTLSQSGIFITASYLDSNRVADLTQRIKQLEQQL